MYWQILWQIRGSPKKQPTDVCVCVCVCVCACVCVCYKELVHMIMESGLSQDLQGELATWRPRSADGEFLSEGQHFQDPGRANASV